jgi:hypothetical protein
LKWYEDNGVVHDKIKYPVMFGKGDNQYPGMAALQDIGKNEVILKVPGRHIISTRAAFYSDINNIVYENPELFGKTVADGEDMMLHAFILHEHQKGQQS